MKIRLDRLGDEPYVWQETLTVAPEVLDRPELQTLGPIGCRGRISRAAPDYWFQAQLVYEQTLACTRCLRPVAVPMTVDLELWVRVESTETGAEPDGDPARAKGPSRGPIPAPAPLGEDELGSLRLREPILDTEGPLREQLQLNVPMKLLCREDCAGLCATCGADLNQGACACLPQVDPRWAALAALGANRPSDSDH